MKKRAVLLLAILLVLYIPVLNIGPYYSPSATPTELNTQKEFMPSATDYDVEIADDDDESFWWDSGGSWANKKNNQGNLCSNTTYDAIVYMRWQINVPRYATINSADLSIWPLVENDQQHTVRRITEADVAGIESRADNAFPNVTQNNQETFTADAVEWEVCNITDMLQDQVNLEQWFDGQYFGVGIVGSAAVSTEFEDYSHTDSHHAYLNITYSGGGGPPPPPSEGTEWFTNDIVGFGWLSANTPPSWYDNETDRTYVAFEGDLDAIDGDGDIDPHITYYDHAMSQWSDVYWVAYNPLNDWPPPSYTGDKHGCPSMWIDNAGYIHILYGAHASRVIQHEKSDSPNDITSFSAATDPCSATWNPSYPHTYYDRVNDVVHLFYRGYTDGRYIVYQNSTDNGDTWNTPQTIVYMGIDSIEEISNRPYPGESQFTDNEILHISFHNHSMYPASHAGADHDFFYVQFNVTNGHIYNVTGYDFGVMADPDEVQDCRFYEYPDEDGTRSGVPDLFVDDVGDPWIFYFVGDYDVSNPVSFTLRYSYWNSTDTAWQSANITNHYVSGNSAAAQVWTSDNITIWSNIPADGLVHEWTWNGTDWEDQGEIVTDNDYLVSWTSVPEHYELGNRTELQVIFCEYEGGAPPFSKCKGWAYGSGGLLGRGAESPTNLQAPECSNLDDTDNLYGRLRDYQIEVYTHDADGYANISYVEYSLYSNDRGTLYWTVRYTEDTDTFTEQSDTNNIITLNITGSTNSSSGNTMNATFYVTVHWNHTDLTDTDAKCYVVDYDTNSDTDWYDSNWDIETRLDVYAYSLGPENSGQGSRADLYVTGTVIYYTSAITLNTTQVDVWLTWVGDSTASDTDLVLGVFNITSVVVDTTSRTYTVKVVEEGAGSGGNDLSYTTHTVSYTIQSVVVGGLPSMDLEPLFYAGIGAIMILGAGVLTAFSAPNKKSIYKDMRRGLLK